MMRPLPPFRAQPLRFDADRKPVRQAASAEAPEPQVTVKAARRPVRKAARLVAPRMKVLARGDA